MASVGNWLKAVTWLVLLTIVSGPVQCFSACQESQDSPCHHRSQSMPGQQHNSCIQQHAPAVVDRAQLLHHSNTPAALPVSLYLAPAVTLVSNFFQPLGNSQRATLAKPQYLVLRI